MRADYVEFSAFGDITLLTLVISNLTLSISPAGFSALCLCVVEINLKVLPMGRTDLLSDPSPHGV
jgi:hypothetical protein